MTEIQDGAPVDDRLASSMGDVYITVQDINDTPPKFNINETEVNCFENSPDGTPLQDLNLFVMDPDVVRHLYLTPMSKTYWILLYFSNGVTLIFDKLIFK